VSYKISYEQYLLSMFFLEAACSIGCVISSSRQIIHALSSSSVSHSTAKDTIMSAFILPLLLLVFLLGGI